MFFEIIAFFLGELPEWLPKGPTLGAAEQQCFHSFFIVLADSLKRLWNFGLGLQFNITYNPV